MMLAQTNKINTSSTVKDSVFAQFEQFHSCSLFKNSKQLLKVELLNIQIGVSMKRYWMKTRTFTIVVAIGLGLRHALMQH